ncbi:MAG: hypothetical protein V4850_21115 [Myxococcota bacterium]
MTVLAASAQEEDTGGMDTGAGPASERPSGFEEKEAGDRPDEAQTCNSVAPEPGIDPMAEWIVAEGREASVLVYVLDREDLRYRVDYLLRFNQTSVSWSSEELSPTEGATFELPFELPFEARVSELQSSLYSQVRANLVVMDAEGGDLFVAGGGSIMLTFESDGWTSEVLGWSELTELGGLRSDGSLNEEGTLGETAEGVPYILTGVAAPL